MTIEKLFIGFWIWHSLEFVFSLFIHDRKRKNKHREMDEATFKRQKLEIEYWKTNCEEAALILMETKERLRLKGLPNEN